VYARRFLEVALQNQSDVELVVSAAGARVAQAELGLSYNRSALQSWLGPAAERVRLHPVEDIGARIASGSYPTVGMVIVPCSMGSVGRIAQGLSSNLIERAADVTLKERRPLVLVPRESPLSILHLENLLRLSRAGATVLPASPGFYARPQKIEDLVEFLVERIAQALGVAWSQTIRWQGEP
jgi:4-hydroxy-3-polyprenylbenzoate decarboxylase